MRDPKREAWLKSNGTEFIYCESFDLNKINMVTSLQNQARIGEPLIDDMVEDYAVALENGDQFPAIVVFLRPHQNDYIVVDGNHRTAAAGYAEIDCLDAYIINGKDAMELDILTRSANSIEGLREDRSKRIEQAKYIVKRYNLTIKETAEHFRLHSSVLQKELKIDETVSRLLKQDADHNLLVHQSLYRLSALADDVVLKEAAEISSTAKLTSPEVSSLVTRINKESGEENRLNLLKEFKESPEIRERIKMGGKARRKYSPRAALFRLLSSLENLLDSYPTAAKLQVMNARDAERITQKKESVCASLDTVLREARKAERHENVTH